MHRYIYLHISGTNMCAYSIKHSFHKILLLLSLSLPSKTLQEQELRDLLGPWHFFHFLDSYIILCQQWVLHQDVWSQSVPKGSYFNSEDNDIFDMYRHTKLLKKKTEFWSNTFTIGQETNILASYNGQGTYNVSLLNFLFVNHSVAGSPRLFIEANE